MKKLLISFAILGLVSFVAPKIADAACPTEIIECCDGSQYYATCCDVEDYKAWVAILCGTSDDGDGGNGGS